MTSPATSPHGPIQTLIQCYAIVKARIFDTVQKLNQNIVPVVVGTFCVYIAHARQDQMDPDPDPDNAFRGSATFICANIHTYAPMRMRSQHKEICGDESVFPFPTQKWN